MTIPRGGSRRRPGIKVHATRSLERAETTVRDGIPCTTPARTLLDLAAVVSARTLERAVEQAVILRLFDRAAMEGALAKAGGRRGAHNLRLALARTADEPPPLRSELERSFQGLVESAGLPPPVVNGLVAGYEVDFHWPMQHLVVETDGRATHETPWGFERDRRRDLDLELAGWHVVRITWAQLAGAPGRVATMLRARLRVDRRSA